MARSIIFQINLSSGWKEIEIILKSKMSSLTACCVQNNCFISFTSFHVKPYVRGNDDQKI